MITATHVPHLTFPDKNKSDGQLFSKYSLLYTLIHLARSYFSSFDSWCLHLSLHSIRFGSIVTSTLSPYIMKGVYPSPSLMLA